MKRSTIMKYSTPILCLALLLPFTAAAQKVTQVEHASDIALSDGVRALISKDGKLRLDDERIYCAREEATGRRLQKVYCQTVEEKQLETRRHQHGLSEYIRKK